MSISRALLKCQLIVEHKLHIKIVSVLKKKANLTTIYIRPKQNRDQGPARVVIRKLACVSVRQSIVPCVSVRQSIVPCVSVRQSIVPCVSVRQSIVSCVSVRQSIVPCVSVRQSIVPCVNLPHWSNCCSRPDGAPEG